MAPSMIASKICGLSRMKSPVPGWVGAQLADLKLKACAHAVARPRTPHEVCVSSRRHWDLKEVLNCLLIEEYRYIQYYRTYIYIYNNNMIICIYVFLTAYLSYPTVLPPRTLQTPQNSQHTKGDLLCHARNIKRSAVATLCHINTPLL